MKVATVIQIVILIIALLYNLFIIGADLLKIDKKGNIWYYSIALGMSAITSILSLLTTFFTDYSTHITYAIISLICLVLSCFHCGSLCSIISKRKKDK